MTTAADRRKLNKDAGFSLLELLIAVVILAIIVIPLLNLFLSSNRLNIKSRQTLRATTAAQDIMEGLKAYNIDEIKEQFDKPANGFYVIDSRLIKGGVAEETTLEVDGSGNPAPGLYVFSMKELNMQGSKFDAKIVVDARGYMTGTTTHDNAFNDAALADARSIDKNNGTFVEAEKYRTAILGSVFKDTDIKSAIEATLRASGVADADLANEYQKTQDAVHFKNLSTFFDNVSRTITIELTTSSEVDKDGNPKVDMAVTDEYSFTYKGKNKTTSGDMGSGVMVSSLNCGNITRMKDAATGNESINVNLFYYPLYGQSTGKVSDDKIIINNASGADLNLLIAKQRHERQIDDPSNPGHKVPDISDPEYYSDPQLMAAEQTYQVEIEINDTYGFDPDQFALKTNLGLNLVGQKYMGGASIALPSQFSPSTIAGRPLNQLNIFTLDGVRSPLGKAGAPGEATELIYDVEVSVYEEGAAAAGFPDDKRMVVIGGSTTN